MKPFGKISYLIILMSSLMILGCTHDTEYIAGPAGADGIDGIDGHDGLDGADGSAAVCIACHSASHRDPINTSYILSGHGSGGSWARGTSGTCAQCHNDQGYVDYLSGLFVDENGIQSAHPDGYAVSNPISCTGCHSDHRSFDFENDGNDYALRNIAPVSLVLDPTLLIDFKNDSNPLGTSNACITCHQPRPSYPIPAGTGDYTITSSRFGPHHGPQSTILEGIMGANIAGSTGYPGVGSATHRSGSSCISCHMGETTDGTDGAHSWKPTLNSCIACHDTMTAIPDGIGGFAADFEILHNLLVAKGYISESGSVLGASGSNAGSSNPLVVPVKDAQAIWNYKTVEEDQSNGIHNPAYTRALLKNSIEALQ